MKTKIELLVEELRRALVDMEPPKYKLQTNFSTGRSKLIMQPKRSSLLSYTLKDTNAIAKKGLSSISYTQLLNMLRDIQLTDEEVKRYTLLYLRDAVQKFLKRDKQKQFSFAVDRIILEDGSVGRVRSFTDIEAIQSMLKAIHVPFSISQDIVVSYVKTITTDPLMFSFAMHILSDDKRMLLQYQKGTFILPTQVSSKGEMLSFDGDYASYDKLFSNFRKKADSMPDEDFHKCEEIISKIGTRITVTGFSYTSPFFLPMQAYIFHLPAPVNTKADLFYQLIKACPFATPEISFLQANMTPKGKFEKKTDYDQAESVLTQMFVPKNVMEFMMSDLTKKKAPVVNATVKSPKKVYIPKEVEEEEHSILTMDEKALLQAVNALTIVLNGADRALLQSMQQMNFADAFAYLETMVKKDLLEQFSVMKAKGYATDLGALLDLYYETADASLLEEKPYLIEEMSFYYRKAKELEANRMQSLSGLPAEIYYLVQDETDDILSDVRKLTKEEKKEFMETVERVRTGKFRGFSINQFCYYAYGDRVFLYYSVLPNGVICILRAFPVAEKLNSRGFFKSQDFWSRLNELFAVAKENGRDWNKLFAENDTAKAYVAEKVGALTLENKKDE